MRQTFLFIEGQLASMFEKITYKVLKKRKNSMGMFLLALEGSLKLVYNS